MIENKIFSGVLGFVISDGTHCIAKSVFENDTVGILSSAASTISMFFITDNKWSTLIGGSLAIAKNILSKMQKGVDFSRNVFPISKNTSLPESLENLYLIKNKILLISADGKKYPIEITDDNIILIKIIGDTYELPISKIFMPEIDRIQLNYDSLLETLNFLLENEILKTVIIETDNYRSQSTQNLVSFFKNNDLEYTSLTNTIKSNE